MSRGFSTEIIILISRSVLTDEQSHIFPEALNLLDCVGLQMGNASICFFILLKVSFIFKLYGIQSESKNGVAKVCLAGDAFLDVLSYLRCQEVAQEDGDGMNPFR